jgi:hypothetical protein
LDNTLHVGKLKWVIASAAITLLVSVWGSSFVDDSNMGRAKAMVQEQASGTIKGVGTSEVPRDVCDHFPNSDFLTIQFHASFLLSPDGKTGKVTDGTGILKTTYSNVFGYLSITGGTVNMGVQPGLYSLKGTASFQSSPSSSSCNLPPAAKFSIAKLDGTELKCGNTDLITFNSIPLTGSVTGDVNCATATLFPAVGTGQTHPQSNIKTHTMPPENVKIISATDGKGKSISNGAVSESKLIKFQLSRPTDNVGVASLECSIDGRTGACPQQPPPSSSSSGGLIIIYNNLNPGVHTFTFTAIDSEGNRSSDTFTWTISAKATG